MDELALEEIMDRFGVPGLSLAVIYDFQIHWTKGYGTADVVTNAKVEAHTLFQAASISKPISAMALVKLAQDGKLSLDDDINQVLRSWRLPTCEYTREQTITARMLASHTGGLGDGFGFPGYPPGTSLPTTIQILKGEAPSNVGPVAVVRRPLEVMKYSGGGSTVLQLALSDALQQTFPQIVRENVFEPIGMIDSTFEQPLSSGQDLNAARGHDERGQPMGQKWRVYPELFAAGLWSTATDLAKFMIEIQLSVHGRANRVLSRVNVQELLNPVGIGDFGVGFRIERRGEGWYAYHNGANQGFRCLLVGHKLRGYGLAVMTNSNSGQIVIDHVRERVERIYKWDSLDRPLP